MILMSQQAAKAVEIGGGVNWPAFPAPKPTMRSFTVKSAAIFTRRTTPEA